VTPLLVAAGGAVGAVLRYVLDQLVSARVKGPFPWGTYLVNVLGCLVLGVLAGTASSAEVPNWVLPLLATGLCGGLTTFSTFSFETFRLAEDGAWSRAAANAVGSLVVGLSAAALGYAAAAAIAG
jgi:CrcB protein